MILIFVYSLLFLELYLFLLWGWKLLFCVKKSRWNFFNLDFLYDIFGFNAF